MSGTATAPGPTAEPVDLRLIGPSRIVFGWGAAAGLEAELERAGIRRALVVVDPAVQLPAAARLAEATGAPTFSGFRANTIEADVVAGVDAYRAHDCDGIVAIGGGSTIDGAKLIRLLSTHAGPLASYSIDAGRPRHISSDVPPLIAVPTTAGTGTEVGRAALVTIGATGWKTLVVSPNLVPDTAVLDASLTVTLPPLLTAGIAMDGLSHCIEEILSPRTHPVIDALAAEGVRLIYDSLLLAVRDGQNRSARESLLTASLLGGLGLQKGLGAVHALSHPLASLNVHHGTANAILLPHVLRFNEAAAPEKVRWLGTMLGSTDAPSAVEDLAAACSLPRRLSELGMTERDISRLASRAVREPSATSNPRPLGLDAVRSLYAAAL